MSEQAKKEVERLLVIWDNARRTTKARLAELNERDEGFLFGSFSIADAFFWPVLWVCIPVGCHWDYVCGC